MMNEEYYVGQIFEGIYPPDAAVWCNSNNAYIEKINDTQYEIKENPKPTPPTKEEQKERRAEAYQAEVDPITCHIQRLEDEEQTPEIEQEIAELRQERSEKVEEIKEMYPYPEEVE